jgi:DNA invertase Pin-like site-specific DNA recombinase
MDELLAIDSEARAENTDHAARHRFRQQKAPARELTIERTRAGLEVARQLGRKGGRKVTTCRRSRW